MFILYCLKIPRGCILPFMNEERSSVYFGNLSLSKVIYSLTKSGWIISIPLSRHQEYDLIGDNGNLQKIKVVSTSYRAPSGVFQANLKVSGGNRSGSGKIKFFDSKKCDYLYVVCIGKDVNDYLIPANKVDSKGKINLSGAFDEFIFS